MMATVRPVTDCTVFDVIFCNGVPVIIISFSISCLQCFDAVGWAAGRLSGL